MTSWARALTDSWPFLAFAFWGGAANYIGRIRDGVVRHFSVFELLGELVISGFSGMLAYFVAHEYAMSQWLMAAAVGISGHLGSRTVFVVERAIRRRITESGIAAGVKSLDK